MNPEQMKRLEAKGWKIGTVQEFLQLSPEEEAMVEAGLALVSQPKGKRPHRSLSSRRAITKRNQLLKSPTTKA